MKILIATDSFKGSATSLEVASYLARGIHAVDSTVEVVKVPVADGGEGTVASVLAAVGGSGDADGGDRSFGPTRHRSLGIAARPRSDSRGR